MMNRGRGGGGTSVSSIASTAGSVLGRRATDRHDVMEYNEVRTSMCKFELVELVDLRFLIVGWLVYLILKNSIIFFQMINYMPETVLREAKDLKYYETCKNDLLFTLLVNKSGCRVRDIRSTFTANSLFF